MSLLRVFIAIELPSEIGQKIGQHTAALQARMGKAVRWVPAQNVHLTLKFLGEIPPSSVEQLQMAIQAEAGNHPPFELSIENLGVFPHLRQPRIIWIGVQAPPALKKLQHAIESCTAHLGYPPEGKPFSPHLTIGRVREQISSSELQSIRSAMETTRIEPLGIARVRAIHLFKSDLQPGGAVYTRLFTAPLLQ